MTDGTDIPVTFESRTLVPAVENYAQFERDGLGIVIGVKKFHENV